MSFREFVFEDYRYDPAGNVLALVYRFLDGPRFEERLIFDFPPQPLSPQAEAVLDRIFRLVFLFSGVSYYKAFIPEKLRCAVFPLDPETAGFLQRFYENGLAEFGWTNRIAPRPLSVPLRADHPVKTIGNQSAAAHLRSVGGGKDSIVTLECLKRSGEDLALFSLGDAQPIAACIAASGLPFIRVHRRLDPALFKLNQQGALNGHVPITGILSAIALACAVLAGFDTIAMSNEHSASAPNLVFDGLSINHQYSKSLEFEVDLADYVARCVTPSIAYFSLLRPLAEIEIARRFAQYPQYFDIFRSCNTAFRQLRAERGRHWCGNCPKCRFVFLALAPFVAKDRLIAVFGHNLLEDQAQSDGFAELCGLREYKPFECVGETDESAAVMAYLGSDPSWHDDAVVRRLHGAYPALQRRDPDEVRMLLAARHPHRVPASFMAMLDACG